MKARIVSLLAVMAVVLVTGCSKKEPDMAVMDDTVTTGSSTTGDPGYTSPIVSDMLGGSDRADGSVPPGTEQDLVINIGDRVFFGYDQHDLSAEARGTLERQAQWLRTYPSVSVILEGHADERGTREYNLALGEKRAAAARNYLIALGVEPSRVQTISYGKERPAVLGSDESSWAQNRRGVMVVQ